MKVGVWKRILTVKLSSTVMQKTIIYGENKNPGESNIAISVEGYKYMSALKDTCTIKISNLNYGQIIELIDGKYYNVEVIAGYENGNKFTIFKGGVLYITNSLDSTTNEVIILCASQMVARFGQKRMNLSLSSNINFYSALEFVCKTAGIKNPAISTQLQRKLIDKMTVVDKSPGEYFDDLLNENETLVVNTDEATGAGVTIFDAAQTDILVIDLNDINYFVGGFPQVNSTGLNVRVMPIYNFSPGYVVRINNAIVDISANDINESYENKGIYLDSKGEYFITQVSYRLENRGNDFSVGLLCKSRSLLARITGSGNK